MLNGKSSKTKVLLVTRDLSYPGGSERFIESFLIYGAENYPKQVEFSLFEVEGSGKFVNKSVYRGLKNRGVKTYSSGVSNDNFLSIKKAKRLSNLINRHRFDIVHTALFNSDFTVLLNRLGAVDSYNLIKTIPSFETLKDILPSVEKLKTNRDLLCKHEFFWLSTKFCQFSVALEKNTREWRQRKRIIDGELEDIVSRFTDQIYVVSSRAKQKWLNFGPNADRNIKIYPCCSIGKSELELLDRIQEKKNEFRSKYKVKDKKLAICYLGRLAYGKGIRKLIKIFLSLPQEISKRMLLVIAGTGELENVVRKYESQDSIIFLGQLGRDEVFEVLVAVDVFCLLSDSEGCSLAIQEAMAAETPVFTADVGGNRDLVDNNLTGWLCSSFDDGELIGFLNVISKIGVSQLKQMGKLARKKVEENFLREDIFEKVITDYLISVK
jgi:glycosyltransferase involved in cell wall biosynthesis